MVAPSNLAVPTRPAWANSLRVLMLRDAFTFVNAVPADKGKLILLPVVLWASSAKVIVAEKCMFFTPKLKPHYKPWIHLSRVGMN